MGTGPTLSLHSLALWTLYGVIVAQSPITAQCGKDITLSCTFPTLGLAANQQVNVTWKKPRAEGPDLLVHSYSLGTEKQSEAYRGRTQLDPEGFAKGDASLRLRDVHIQDEGFYSCFVNSELGLWSEETSLTVLRARQRELPVVVQEGEDVTLSCSFEPEQNLRLLNITWKKETAEGRDLLVHTYYNGRDQMLRQNKAYWGRTQLYPERFHEGIASLRLKNVRLEDDGVYTCHVKPKLGRFSMRMRVTVEKGARCVWFFWAPLLLLLALSLLVMVIIIKMHRLPVRWKLRPSKHAFRLEAEQTDIRLSDDYEEKNDNVEGRAQPEAYFLWDIRVDDTKQTRESWQTPAWDERRAWEKPNQPKFSRGKSPAREKFPRNIARKPSKKGRRLGSDGDSADSWSDKFTSEASDFSEVDSAWQEDGRSSQKTRCRIALLGKTGAGKSSFVNAIRGLGDEEEGAAKTGVVETTMVPTSYRLPKQPNITIWDLPGFGPTKRQSDTDLDLFSLSQYDAFLIFSSHHFTATHAGLARKIQRAGKKVYFVRSKVDQELLPARRHQPSTYNEERILQKIRDTCMTHLQREGVTSPQVFLLSSFEYGRHDFPLLEEILQREFGSRFPEIGTSRELRLSATGVSERGIAPCAFVPDVQRIAWGRSQLFTDCPAFAGRRRLLRAMARVSLVCSLHAIVLWTLCGVAGEETAITAQYRKDVTLTCIFPSKFKISFHRLSITWTKEGAQGQDFLVHRFHLKMNWLEGQEEAYRGRTQLYPQEFPQGNASLRLSDVHLHDEGSYLCSVTCELGNWSQKISLTVLSDSETERPIIVQTGEDVILNCSFQSELNHQPLNITWKREEEEGPDLLVHSYCSQLDPLETQDEAYRGRTQLYPERFHEGNASLRLKNVRLEDDGVYICHVKPELGRFSVRMRVAVEKAAELVQSPPTLYGLWLIDLGVLLVILIFALLRMYYPSLRKLLLNKKSPRSEPQQTVSDHKDKEERSHLLRASPLTSVEPGVANPTHSPPAHSSPGQTAKDRGEPRAAPGVQIVPTLISIMQQKALEYTKLNIAIMGELGCGKLSFINAMRGLCDEDEGAAPLGEEEMMMEPKAYQHPKHPSVTFWRLPIDFQPCLQPVKFVHYDFFVIMGLEGFTRKHAELAREIQKAGKMCYFVRSKVDADLDSAKRSRPSTYDEENILHDIHNHCIRCLGEGEMINPEVFLLSAFELDKYDFPRLRDSMEKALPGDKKRALILALPNTSPQILQKKKEALQKQIWKIALVSSLITVIHIPGISTILGITILLIVMRYHCLVFGLDDVSFTVLTRQFGKPAEELKAIMKPQLAKEIRINVVLQLLSSVGCGIFTGAGLSLWHLQVLGFKLSGGVAAVGLLGAGGISLATTYILLKTFLSSAAEDAQRILQKLSPYDNRES
ncbi:unnamed protein product [Eretmochelys imbricata]